MENNYLSTNVALTSQKIDTNSSKYYRNSKEILNDEQKPISEGDFKNIIKHEIFNFIGHFENIILLVGAGASVVGDRDPRFGHTVDMLANEARKQLVDPDYFSLEELSEMCKYYPKEEYNFNLEDFLSQMQAFSRFVSNSEKDKFDKSYTKIIEIIKDKTSYNYDEQYFKHAKLIKQLTDMHVTPNRLSIVTTNYDTIIEESAYSLNYTVFDGFTFSHEPTFDVDMFDWYLSKPISDVKSQKEAYKKSVVNLLKIHGSLTWELEQDKIVRKNKVDLKSPIMIFPSSNKYMQSYQKPYFELFSKFQELLRKPNTLLITAGFSFADNHISQMIIQALKNIPSLSLLITDFNISPEKPNENWKEIEKLMSSNYNIAFLKAVMNTDLTDYFVRGESND